MFIFHSIIAMVPESAITTRPRRKLMCMCGIINDKYISSLASKTSLIVA
jgi:hypothetical protein